MISFRTIEKPPNEEFSVSGLSYLPEFGHCVDLLASLLQSLTLLKTVISKTSAEKLLHSYGPGKWNVKECLVHLVDDERIYSYRALCFARAEMTALPGFNQDDYNRYSGAKNRSIANIMEEYEAVRFATIRLFNGLSDEALGRKGIADNVTFSVRAIGYHIAAHEAHHFKILKEKYLLDI